MASKSKSRTLTDHDEIRRWAEERGAKPAAVRATRDADSTGIIRLDFPGFTGERSLEEIEWDEWFDDFEDNNLALIVQDETADGEQSNFNKLVSRENIEDDSEGPTESSARTSASKKSRPINKGTSRSSTGSQSAPAKTSHSGKGRESSTARRDSKRTTERKRHSSRRKAA